MWHRATTPSPRSRFQQMPRTTMLAPLIPIQERRFPECEISLETCQVTTSWDRKTSRV